MPPAELEPLTAAMLARAQALGLPPIESLPPQQAREQLAALARLRPAVPGECAAQALRVPAQDGAVLEARLYRPEGAVRPSPVVVYFHGGGHVIGSIDTHDDVARRIALDAGVALVSVGYRKGPEARFPTAVEDAWQGLRWLSEHAGELGLNAARMAVMGDSAGANLATVVTMLARDHGAPPLSLQILVYPVTDYRLQAQSFKRYASGYGVLSAQAMHWFRGHYLRGDADAKDWRASPILAPSLGGLPPALVLSAACDPLIDDIRRYVAQLQSSGVETEYIEYAGTVHGFFANPHLLDAARDAHARVAARLRADLLPN